MSNSLPLPSFLPSFFLPSFPPWNYTSRFPGRRTYSLTAAFKIRLMALPLLATEALQVLRHLACERQVLDAGASEISRSPSTTAIRELEPGKCR